MPLTDVRSQQDRFVFRMANNVAPSNLLSLLIARLIFDRELQNTIRSWRNFTSPRNQHIAAFNLALILLVIVVGA
jgi:hypothetical protein